MMQGPRHGFVSLRAFRIVPACVLYSLIPLCATFSFTPSFPGQRLRAAGPFGFSPGGHPGQLRQERSCESARNVNGKSWQGRQTLDATRMHMGRRDEEHAPKHDHVSDSNEVNRLFGASAMSRRAMLGLGAAALLVGNTKPAEAGFGSAGGMAISPPPVKKLSLDDLLQLGKDKRDQRTGSLFGNNLDNILNQIEKKQTQNQETLPEFNKLIEQLREDAMYAKLEEKVKQRNAELAAQKEIKRQLKARQELLDRLGKQPQWISYGAAFFASISSTLVMHPVDTLKVRLMGKQGQKDLEVVDNFYSAPPDEEASETSDMSEGEESEDTDEPLVFQVSSSEGRPGRGPGGDSGNVAVQAQPQAEVETERGSGEHAEEVNARLVSAAASSGTVTVERKKWKKSELEEESFLEKLGILTLYEGLAPNIVKEAPSSALYLGVYEAARSALNLTPLVQQELIVYLLAGAVGELFGSVIRAPSEAVKTRVQTGEGSTIDAVKAVLFTENGRKQCLKSWTSSLFRDVPAGAIQIAVFEGLKIYILTSPNIDYDVGTLSAEAFLGSLGGGFAAFLTTPADVTTTTLITSANQGKDLSVMEVVKATWETDGLKGFFTGSLQRTLYWAPAIGIFLSVYCSLRQFAMTQGF